MLRFEAVGKRYSSRPVLASFTLEVEEARSTVLIGPSGCGKSTALRLVLGLIQPDEGGIRYRGEPVLGATTPEFRRRVGYVIQGGGLFPHLTAGDNVTLVARHLGWERSRLDERLGALRELTRLPADALERFPLQLSGGQRQRVALMRALMLDPELLLLDEPLGALDPMIRFDLQEELREIFRALGKTVLLVTHDLAEAAWFADTIALMREGSLVQTGRLDDFVDRPADPFVTRFITAQREHRLGEGRGP